MPTTPEPNDLTLHWRKVGGQLQERSASGRTIAGDDTPFFRYKRKQFLRTFLAPLPVTGKDVLELGCGPGGNLVELLESHPHRLVGADISPEMLVLARERVGERAELVEVELARDLPFADEELDLAFTATVLQHNPPEIYEHTLRELCRVVAGDLYLFEDVGPASTGNPTHWARPSEWYTSVAVSAGLELVGIRPLPISISSWVCQSLAIRFGHDVGAEGERIGRKQLWSERLALTITRVIDRLVSRQGLVLTELHYRRPVRR